MDDEKFKELIKQIHETAKGDLDAISKLTLDQVRDLIRDHIDSEQAVTDACMTVFEVLPGRTTQQMVATGLSLVMLGMELLAKDITEIPNIKKKEDLP